MPVVHRHLLLRTRLRIEVLIVVYMSSDFAVAVVRVLIHRLVLGLHLRPSLDRPNRVILFFHRCVCIEHLL